MQSFSENTQYNIDENVDDRGKLFDGEMDGDSEFNGWKSQQNIYLQLKVIPQKNVHKKRMSKDFELQNSKLAPMHNSSSSKEPENENITLRPETSKSFEEPENSLSKEPGGKGLSMEPAQDNSPKQHQQKRFLNETDEAN